LHRPRDIAPELRSSSWLDALTTSHAWAVAEPLLFERLCALVQTKLPAGARLVRLEVVLSDAGPVVRSGGCFIATRQIDPALHHDLHAALVRSGEPVLVLPDTNNGNIIRQFTAAEPVRLLSVIQRTPPPRYRSPVRSTLGAARKPVRRSRRPRGRAGGGPRRARAPARPGPSDSDLVAVAAEVTA
jgi:hypothetical protein